MQIQAVNDAGNLVFFLFLLASVTLTVIVVYRKLRGRQIGKPGIALVACLCAYMAILLAVSFGSKTGPLALGTDKCFDDWCASVLGARSLPAAGGSPGTKAVAVTLRISNRARWAAFRPSQPRVTLALASGESIPRSNPAQREFEKQVGPQEDLAKRLVAGESFQTVSVFEVPAATRQASVVLLEGPSIVTRFLVGDENSFFHGKMVYPITVE